MSRTSSTRSACGGAHLHRKKSNKGRRKKHVAPPVAKAYEGDSWAPPESCGKYMCRNGTQHKRRLKRRESDAGSKVRFGGGAKTVRGAGTSKAKKVPLWCVAERQTGLRRLQQPWWCTRTRMLAQHKKIEQLRGHGHGSARFLDKLCVLPPTLGTPLSPSLGCAEEAYQKNTNRMKCLYKSNGKQQKAN